VPGWEAIAFASTLDGGTISLTSTDPASDGVSALAIADTDGVAIDATSLLAGLTISKPAGNYRLFRINAGKRLSLHQLTLSGGQGVFLGACRTSKMKALWRHVFARKISFEGKYSPVDAFDRLSPTGS
jgi:hypothetical protein